MSRDKNKHLTQGEIDQRFDRAVKHSMEYRVHALLSLQDKVPLCLTEGMTLFSLLDVTNTGDLSREEIKDGCTHETKKNAAVTRFLEKYENTPLGLLKNEKQIDLLFSKVDLDNDGRITLSEWKLFLAELIERDLQYLVEKGWAANNAYWAMRPRTEPEPRFHFLFAVEWWADLWYYVCNNNSLFGIFLYDRDNGLKRLERLNILLCCQSWALLFTALLSVDPSDSDTTKYLFIFFYVTLPVFILRNILLICFKCPCLVRRHNLTCLRRICIPFLEFLGHLIGFITFLGAVLALVLAILVAADIRNQEHFWGRYLLSFAMGIVLEVVQCIVVPFNPFVATRYFVENCCCICCCCRLGGLAKWQIQRKVAFEAHEKNGLPETAIAVVVGGMNV